MDPISDRTVNDRAAIAAECAPNLLKLRARNGAMQKRVALGLGMTGSMISQFERGDHVPSLKTLCRIADAFSRRLEIVFREHKHIHVDDRRHSHRHSDLDPDHRHSHREEK
jgi:transcriptional regulator with XRE-family HTH domain